MTAIRTNIVSDKFHQAARVHQYSDRGCFAPGRSGPSCREEASAELAERHDCDRFDHSPSIAEITEWETLAGFPFENGTIFEALQKKGITRRLYGGDDFPMVSTLKGIHLDDIRQYSQFAGDLSQATCPFSYVFIESSYVAQRILRGAIPIVIGHVVNPGEALIKSTYEAIRGSAFWESSLLLITWDEHGGFYDHTIPQDAVAPGDTGLDSRHNKNGFTFEKYGPRVPR